MGSSDAGRAAFPRATALLECVVNVSEGRDQGILASLGGACGPTLLDVHSDFHHNRSVFTLAGPPVAVEPAVRELARLTVSRLDLRRHSGVHPRFGVLDVVPFVGLEGWPVQDARAGSPAAMAAAAARQSFAAWAADTLGLPVFLYGPERSLPDVRRAAWRQLAPDFGPPAPHPTAGSVAAGWRPLLVAYNLWMAEEVGLRGAKAIVARLRAPEVRALAFQVGAYVQVSCNLIRPLQVGPAQVWDEVSRWARVSRAEVVGLVPSVVLAATDEDRWPELGLSPSLTIEARLLGRGLLGQEGGPVGTQAASPPGPPGEPGAPR